MMGFFHFNMALLSVPCFLLRFLKMEDSQARYIAEKTLRGSKRQCVILSFDLQKQFY